VSQLSIFVRIVQNNFSHVEEFLNFLPLHGTPKGCDIFKAVNQTLEKFGIDFSRCSTIVTDVARAMIRSKNEFADYKATKFKVLHYSLYYSSRSVMWESR